MVKYPTGCGITEWVLHCGILLVNIESRSMVSRYEMQSYWNRVELIIYRMMSQKIPLSPLFLLLSMLKKLERLPFWCRRDFSVFSNLKYC